MKRLAALFTVLLAMLACGVAHADPSDIEAASRGVVRVVIVGKSNGKIYPISHGSGFAVEPEMVVTNAHVVREAADNPNVSIGIVPSDGGQAVYGRLITISDRNDLALVAATSPLHLPPLTIAGAPPSPGGKVVAIGYPMNVDEAQGLGIDDIFRPQPPVTSQGFLSGNRPSRDFDTLLHTAPIARGNSGGPLVDPCGRVIGVNSFGTEPNGSNGEFFFAVSTRELLPFLRANGITPRVTSMPCRSLAELNAQERRREENRRLASEMQAQQDEQAQELHRTELRREIEFTILDQRSNGLALSFFLLLLALGGTAFSYDSFRRGAMRQRAIGGGVALLALAGAGVAWLSRPTFNEVDDRLQDQLRAEMTAGNTGVIGTPAPAPKTGKLTCTLDPTRSRVVTTPKEQLPLQWSGSGCADNKLQYGISAGDWVRVLVPSDEETVSVDRYDPSTGNYVIDRYMLDHKAMTTARAARGQYEAPACGSGETAAQKLGSDQQGIISLLPSSPNDRLFYSCTPTQSRASAGQGGGTTGANKSVQQGRTGNEDKPRASPSG